MKMLFRGFFKLIFIAFFQQAISQPGTIANLELWFAADSGITLIGNNVSQWQDLSSDAYLANAGVNQPTFIDSISLINNKPAINFDGTSSLTALSVSMPGGNDVSVFVLTRVNLKTNFGMFACHGSNAAGTWNLRQVSTSGNPSFISGSNNSGAVGSTDLEGRGFVLLSGFFTGSNNEWQLFENDLSAALNTNAFTLSVSEDFYIGHRNDAFKLDGDIAEIIVYNRNLSDPEKATVRTYIYDKYAPAVDLGPDTVAYGFCGITLDAGAHFTQFLWNTGVPGDTLQTLAVNQSGIYSVTVTDIFGFTSADSILVTFPDSLSPLSDTTACYGDTLIWDTQLDSTYSFLWQDSSFGSLFSISQTGLYHVEITDSSSCKFFTDSINVSVDTFALVASLGSDTVMCSGNYITLQQGGLLAKTYLWPNSSTGSSYTVDTTGSYWVTVADSVGCVATDTIMITIQGVAPNAEFSATAVCYGNNTVFSDSSKSLDASNLISWSWDFGDIFNSSDTSSLQNPAYLFDSSGTYNVILTVVTDSGCFDSVSKNVVVNAIPVPSFEALAPACINNPVTFTNNTTIVFGTIANSQWDFGEIAINSDTSSLQNPSHTYTYTGEYNVKLKATSSAGCADSVTNWVKVFIEKLCYIPSQISNLELWFAADTGITLVGNNVSQWQDLSSDAYIANAGVNQPLFVDSVSVINNKPLVNFDGTSSLTALSVSMPGGNDVSVFALARVNLKTSFGMFGCHGSNAVGTWNLRQANATGNPSFVSGANNLGAVGTEDLEGRGFVLLSGYFTGSTDEWELFENDLSVATTTNTFTLSASEDFYIGHRNGAFKLDGDIAEMIVYNRNLSDSEKTIIKTYLYCKYAPPVDLGPDTITYGFCGVTLDAGAHFSQFEWNTGDTLQTLVVNQSGIYSVSVTDIFGFTSVDSIAVSFPDSLSPLSDTTACFGDILTWAPQLDSTYSFLWHDSSSATMFSISQTGSYYVEITDSLNCKFFSDSISVYIDTFALAATLGPDTMVCSGDSIYLKFGYQSGLVFNWASGSTGSSVAVSGSIGQVITDTLTVINANGCKVKDTISISIKGINPTVNYTVPNVCLNDTSFFIDATTATAPDAPATWSWQFGDSTSNSLQNPTHIYSSDGTYSVSLIVVTDSGCIATHVDTTQVFAPPTSDFFIGSDTLCSSDQVQFAQNITQGDTTILSRLWNFGDTASGAANTSASDNPIHQFTDAGDYFVQLVATDDNSCIDTFATTITINPNPIADILYISACKDDTTMFIDNSLGATIISRQWNFGDPSSGANSSILANPTHVYDSSISYTVILNVTDIYGCTSVDTQIVQIFQQPTAMFTASPCVGDSSVFTDQSSVADGTIQSWNWEVISGTQTSTLQHPSFVFADTSSRVVKLEVTSSNGCSAETQLIVQANGNPVVGFVNNSGYGGEAPLSVEFTDTSGAFMITWQWDFGDGSSSTAQHPTHSFVANGDYLVQLIGVDTNGCRDTATTYIKVGEPYWDIAISQLAVPDPVSGYYSITATVVNQSNRSISNFDITADVGSSSNVRETWSNSGNLLNPSQAMNYTFSAQFETNTGTLPEVICVSTSNPNGLLDQVPSNDEWCTTNTDFEVVRIYPNPASDKLTIEFVLPEKGQVQISLFDEIGRWTQQVFSGEGSQGLNRVEVELFQLSQGVHALRVVYNQEVEITPFVITR